jgi:hypothetical protein
MKSGRMEYWNNGKLGQRRIGTWKGGILGFENI